MRNIIIILVLLVFPVTAWAARAKVKIKGTTPESMIKGNAVFEEEDEGVLLKAYIANVPPGKHGFHIHENGSCDDVGQAAGGHFNPDNVDHGLLPKDGHEHAHSGDMGNIDIRPDGTGILRILLPKLTINKGKYAIVGRSIILHEKEDDFTQPTGNAGGRIGCGVIEEIPEQKDPGV